ncbi:MAG: DPP IV N-terminal domain-containing protein [Thermodesulfobacteriota bacterium]
MKQKIKYSKNILLIFLFTFSAFIVTAARPGLADDLDNLKFIDISNPFINKTPLAIPEFSVVEKDSELEEVVKEGTSYLRYLFKFTSYFEIIEEDSLPEGITGSEIDFEKRKKNSELLVTCALYYNNDILEMELRLFDVLKKDLITGKRYKGKKEDLKKMLRRFASEVMEELFDNKGLFESRLAFVSDSSGEKEICLSDFDGSDISKLTNDKSIAISPSWSYDNNWIAYTSYKRGIPEIYVKSLKGDKGYIISEGRLNITPEWLPGKFALAAVMSIDKDPDIFILTGKGEKLKTAVKGWGIDVSPSFSPDGNKMAFVSGRRGSPQIYIKDFKTNKIKRLTFEGNYNTSPAWSPSGDYISYVGMTKEDGINIYLIRPDGTGLRQLTTGPGDNEEPSWSPDGSLIAFTSTRSGKKKIYIMTRFGNDQRLLISNMAGNQSDPAWSR